ncbi:hypothetical protein V8F06_011472 [Rhypophila decipiens]
MKTTSTLFGVTTFLATWTILTMAASDRTKCSVNDCPSYPPCGFPCMAQRLKQLGCPNVECACPLSNFASNDFVSCLYLECNASNKDIAMAVLQFICQQAGKPIAMDQKGDSLYSLNSSAPLTVTVWEESSEFPQATPYAAPGANGGGPGYGYGSAPDSSVTAGDPMSGVAPTSGESVPTVTVTVVATSSVRSPSPAQVTFASGERIVPRLFGLGLVLLTLAVLRV